MLKRQVCGIVDRIHVLYLHHGCLVSRGGKIEKLRQTIRRTKRGDFYCHFSFLEQFLINQAAESDDDNKIQPTIDLTIEQKLRTEILSMLLKMIIIK